MNNLTSSLALLAALQTTGNARTARGMAYRLTGPSLAWHTDRPYCVMPADTTRQAGTYHATPALAVARLASL